MKNIQNQTLQLNYEQVGKDFICSAAFQVMLENTTDMIFVKDVNLRYVTASLAFAQMMGVKTVSELIGHSDYEILRDMHLARRYVTDDQKMLREGKNLIEYIEPLVDSEGRPRYGSTSKYVITDGRGKALGIFGMIRDITRDYVAKQRYQHELKYLFEMPKDVYGVTYIDVDKWRIISQRHQFIGSRAILSSNSVEEFCENAVRSIIDRECDAAKFYGNFTPEILRSIYESGTSDLLFRYKRAFPDGSLHWVQNQMKFLVDVDSGRLCALLTAKDIDEEKMREERLIQAAQMDKMTMVLNRETTMERIRRILRRDSDRTHVLLMFDVDNFKKLNDTKGHQTGDEFLIEFAGELRKHFRESDVIGRVGGDEFFALMKNASEVTEIREKVEEIMAVLQGICAKYADVSLSVSIGISAYPNDGKTLEELYSKADAALYEAKKAGKNRYAFAKKSP